MIFPNRVKASYRYDPAGNVLEIRYERMQAGPVLASPEALPAGQAGATQSIISRTRYYYDELGNCVSKREGLSGLMLGLPPSRETTYAYDKLSRLTEVKEPDGRTTAYTYDPAGNRLTREVVPGRRPGTTHEKEASAYNELNQLIAQGNTVFEYDPMGNLILKRVLEKTARRRYDLGALLAGVNLLGETAAYADDQESGSATRYRYDFDGRLEETVSADGKTASYRYDPLGRTVSETASDGTRRYGYDGENLLLEMDGQGNPTRSYSRDPGTGDPLASQDLLSNEIEHFAQDPFGYVTTVLDRFGQVSSTTSQGPDSGVSTTGLPPGGRGIPWTRQDAALMQRFAGGGMSVLSKPQVQVIQNEIVLVSPRGEVLMGISRTSLQVTRQFPNLTSAIQGAGLLLSGWNIAVDPLALATQTGLTPQQLTGMIWVRTAESLANLGFTTEVAIPLGAKLGSPWGPGGQALGAAIGALVIGTGFAWLARGRGDWILEQFLGIRFPTQEGGGVSEEYPAGVPEPPTWILGAMGILFVWLFYRRRRSVATG